MQRHAVGEVVRVDIRKRAFKIPPLGQKAKLVCIPTSSGTGSEVTPFAVITDHKTGYKYPITDYALTPSVAIVDPVLARTQPRRLASDAGFDALTHSMEAYVSVYARSGCTRAWPSGRAAGS